MEFLFASFSKAISRLDDKTGTRFNAHIIFIGYNALSPCKIGLLLQAYFALKYADNILHAIGNLYAEQRHGCLHHAGDMGREQQTESLHIGIGLAQYREIVIELVVLF